jgi:vitamin B12 transporter
MSLACHARSLISFFLFLVSVSHAIFASTPHVRCIPEVTIYASRPEDQIPFVKRFDTNSMRSVQKISVIQVLKQAPGVTVQSFGNDSPQSYIALRGANTEHTQVRILGVEVNDPSSGGRFDFSDIFSGDAKELTVRHFSSLSAIGGVVDIEPHKGYGEPKGMAEAEAGSYQTDRIRAQVAGSTARSHYFLGANLLKSGTGKLKNHLHGNILSDRHWIETFNTRFGHQLNDIWDVDVYLSQSKSKNDIDRVNVRGLPFKSGDHGVHQRGIAIVKNRVETLQGRWRHDVVVSDIIHHRDYSENSQNSTYTGETRGALYHTHLRIDDHHTFMTSLGIMQDRVETSNVRQHQLKSTNGEMTYRTSVIPKLALEVMGRLDHHDFFKTHGTYFGHAKYRIHPDIAVFTSYGTAFRAPTAFDFFASGPYSVGNPDLKSMTSRNVELGTEVTLFKGMSVAFTYFHLNIKDLLATTRTPQGKYRRVNQAGRSTEGLETFAIFHFGSTFQLRTAYTLTEATDEQTQSRPIRLSRHQFHVGVEITCFKNASLFAEGFYRSPASDIAFSRNGPQRVKLPAALDMRLGGTYHLNNRVEVTGRIENFLHDKNESSYGYPNRGISFFMGIRIKT